MAGKERARATWAVSAVIDQGRSLDRVLTTDDGPLVRALAYETLRWHRRLEAVALRLLDKPPRKRDIALLRLIEIGLVQLLYFQIADHAAINETVAAAPRIRQPRGKGLVNAVLRRFQREQDAILEAVDRNPANHSAYPAWLHQRISADWPDEAEAILQAGNARAPMWLRINEKQLNRADYLKILQDSDIEATAGKHGETSIALAQPVDANHLPGLMEGLVSVQDQAAQQAPELMDLQAEQPIRVLDACAAPGGKTGHLAERLGDNDQLLAIDNAEERQQLTRDNLKRLELSAEVKVADAARPDDWWDGEAFDRILLDAPCSATGVIRRHPDIKSLRRESDIASLVEHQRELLDTLWGLLAKGGVLVYATCSVLKDENERQIEAFLERHPEASEQTADFEWGQKRSVGRQILPGDDDMDGFYYAALRKP